MADEDNKTIHQDDVNDNISEGDHSQEAQDRLWSATTDSSTTSNPYAVDMHDTSTGALAKELAAQVGDYLSFLPSQFEKNRADGQPAFDREKFDQLNKDKMNAWEEVVKAGDNVTEAQVQQLVDVLGDAKSEYEAYLKDAGEHYDFNTEQMDAALENAGAITAALQVDPSERVEVFNKSLASGNAKDHMDPNAIYNAGGWGNIRVNEGELRRDAASAAQAIKDQAASAAAEEKDWSGYGTMPAQRGSSETNAQTSGSKNHYIRYGDKAYKDTDKNGRLSQSEMENPLTVSYDTSNGKSYLYDEPKEQNGIKTWRPLNPNEIELDESRYDFNTMQGEMNAMKDASLMHQERQVKARADSGNRIKELNVISDDIWSAGQTRVPKQQTAGEASTPRDRNGIQKGSGSGAIGSTTNWREQQDQASYSGSSGILGPRGTNGISAATPPTDMGQKATSKPLSAGKAAAKPSVAKVAKPSSSVNSFGGMTTNDGRSFSQLSAADQALAKKLVSQGHSAKNALTYAGLDSDGRKWVDGLPKTTGSTPNSVNKTRKSAASAYVPSMEDELKMINGSNSGYVKPKTGMARIDATPSSNKGLFGLGNSGIGSGSTTGKKGSGGSSIHFM